MVGRLALKNSTKTKNEQKAMRVVVHIQSPGGDVYILLPGKVKLKAFHSQSVSHMVTSSIIEEEYSFYEASLISALLEHLVISSLTTTRL